MNEGQIWWGQIGNSLRLLSAVAEILQDGMSAVLYTPQGIPWRSEFYDAVNLRRSEFGADRRFRRVEWTENADPGSFVLNQLCPNQARLEYWPGESSAAFLAGRDDLSLDESDVWITGIRSQTDLYSWIQFLSEYLRKTETKQNKASFILEYAGPEMETPNVRQLKYAVENYDCRVFCLEAAAALNTVECRSYQAELALWIGYDDPERSAVLLNAGKALVEDPAETAKRELAQARNSEGNPFEPLTDKQITSAVWKTGIVLMYPILEQYQLDFIADHQAALECHLPIVNSNGDQVTDPYDLEVGPLSFLVSHHPAEFSQEEVKTVAQYRKIRNQLAHNKPLSYSDVKRIIGK